MARNDGRIEAGQKLAGAISARAWNRAQDAADRVLGVGTGFTGGGATGADPAPNVVLIKNDSGADVPWLGVMGISGTASTPHAGQQGQVDEALVPGFISSPVLTGVVPVSGTHDDAFVIALEPIAQNKIGRAACGGVFAVIVNILNANHKYATVKNGDVTQLQSAGCGSVQLLARPDLPPGSGRYCVGSM
jgi:hypothetical protein